MMLSMVTAGTAGFAGLAAAQDGTETLIVDGEGDGENTYADLSSADDAADPNDRVEIEAGTYEESTISINTDGLSIVSQDGPTETILDAELGIGLHGDDITLEGLTIDVEEDNGNIPAAVVVRGENVSIEGNVINPIEDPSASGILVETDEVTIQDNNITGVEDGNLGGDVDIPDIESPIELNDESFNADNERGIANEIFRSNDEIGIVQADGEQFDEFLGIIHGQGGAGASGSGVFNSEDLRADSAGVDTFQFGSGVDRSIEIRHSDSDLSIQITPEDGEGTFDVEQFNFDNTYDADGEIQDDPEIQLSTPEDRVSINVSVEGDEEIFTDRDSPFAEYEYALFEDGYVIDTSDELLAGIGYQGEIQKEGTGNERTFTVERDDNVEEDWFVEFRVSDTDISKEVDHSDDDDKLEATVDISDVDPGEYSVRFEIYENKDDALSERILNLFSVNELEIVGDSEFEITAVDVDDQNVVAGEDDIEVNATIENIGEFEGTQDVELFTDFGNELEDSEEVTLEPNEKTDVDLTYETETGDNPGVILDVQTVNDRERIDASVESGTPEFQLTNFDVPEAAAQGDEIELEATVENVGGLEGTVDVDFEFARAIDLDDDGSSEETISAGDKTTVSINGTIEDEPRAGEHPVPTNVSLSPQDGVVSTPDNLEDVITVDYEDIESGVEEAAEDDVVLVTAGQYQESVTIDDHGVVVLGVESGVKIEADDNEPVFTLNADKTGISNVDIVDDDVDASAVKMNGEETTVFLSEISGFNTAVEINDGATGAELIGNDFVVDGMDPAVDIEASDTRMIANIFDPESGGSNGNATNLNNGASNSEIRDNTILTTELGESDNEHAALYVGDDASLDGTEVKRNNFDALEEDGLSVEGRSHVDISVEPDDPENNLTADKNYASGGELVTKSPGIDEGETQDEPLSADFTVAIDIEPDELVTTDDSVTVTANVTNDGDQTGSETVVFEVDGEEIATEELSDVDADTDEEVEFTYTPDAEDAGETPQFTVKVDDSTASESIDVFKPSFLAVDELTVENENNDVQSGGEITVQADVDNQGGVESAQQKVELRLGSDVSGTEGDDYTVLEDDNVTIDGNGEETIEFTGVTVDEDAEEIDFGQNEIGIATEDDSEVGLLSVLPPQPVFTASIDSLDETVEVGETVSVNTEIENVGQESDEQDIEFAVDDDVEDSEQVDLASGDSIEVEFTYETTDDDVGDLPVSISTANETVEDTVTVTEQDDSDDDTTSSSGGGGGSSGSATTGDDSEGDDETADDASESEAPTVAEIREELDQMESTTQSQTEISDTDPDQAGVTVSPEETESVQQVTFDDDTASGSVDIREWEEPSESVSESVSSAISEAESNPETTTTANVVTVVDIEPDSDAVRDSSATIQMTVGVDQLDDPESVVLMHERGDSWEALTTTVDESDNGEVTLEAETESFSLFAITEVKTQVESSDEETADQPTDTDDEIPGFGIGAALLALGILLVVSYSRRKQ